MKIINVGNKEVAFEATGDIGRIYRREFGSDIYQDYSKVAQRIRAEVAARKRVAEEKAEQGIEPSPEDDLIDYKEIIDQTIYENIAWAMAKCANPKTPGIDEWLKGFGPLDLIGSIIDVIMLYTESLKTSVIPKNADAAVTK